MVVFFGYRYWYSDKIVPEFSLTNTEVKSEGDTKMKQDIADSGKDADGVKEGDLKITVEGKVGAVDFVKIGISGANPEFLDRWFRFAKRGVRFDQFTQYFMVFPMEIEMICAERGFEQTEPRIPSGSATGYLELLL